MKIITLAISPTEIIAFLSLTILLYVVSLFLSAKHVKGWRFFIWLLVIICIPVIGPISYLIYHMAHVKTSNTSSLE